MSSSLPVNKTAKNSFNLPVVTDSLKELRREATSLFAVLDRASCAIREMESCLSELKAHFPFRYHVSDEPLAKSSQDLGDQERPNSPDRCLRGFTCLSWEQDDDSKNYRLFLVREEKVFIILYHEDNEILQETSSKAVFKKPLIETNLSTRLRYVELLNPFIHEFKNYLAKCRTSIEANNFADIPF